MVFWWVFQFPTQDRPGYFFRAFWPAVSEIGYWPQRCKSRSLFWSFSISTVQSQFQKVALAWQDSNSYRSSGPQTLVKAIPNSEFYFGKIVLIHADTSSRLYFDKFEYFCSKNLIWIDPKIKPPLCDGSWGMNTFSLTQSICHLFTKKDPMTPLRLSKVLLSILRKNKCNWGCIWKISKHSLLVCA